MSDCTSPVTFNYGPTAKIKMTILFSSLSSSFQSTTLYQPKLTQRVSTHRSSPSSFPARQKNQPVLVGYSTTTRVILSLSALGLYPRDTLITTG